jgi:biopolymer transport protein ExbB
MALRDVAARAPANRVRPARRRSQGRHPDPASAAHSEKETVDNPYGLEALWKQGDFCSRGTLIILVIMSMGSWYIMFVKVYEQAKLFKQARIVQDSFWRRASINEGIEPLKEGTPFRYIAKAA